MADGGSSNPQRQYHTGAPDKYPYSQYVNTGLYQTSYTHANEPVFQTGYTRPTEPPSYQTGYIPEPISQTGFTRPAEHPSQMSPFDPSHLDQQFSNRSVHTAPIYPSYRPHPLQPAYTGVPQPNPLSRTEFSGEGPNYHSASSPSLTIHSNNYEGSSYNDHGRLASQMSVPVTRSPHTGRRQDILSYPHSNSSDSETNRPHPSPANQTIEYSAKYPGVATPQNTIPIKSNSNPGELSRFGDIGNVPRPDQYHYQRPAVSPQKPDLQQPMLTKRPYAGPGDRPFENTRTYPNPQPRSDQHLPYRPTSSAPRQAWVNENFSNPGSIPYQPSETSQRPDSHHFRPIPDQYQYQTPTSPVSNPQNDPHFDHRNSKDSTSSNQSPSSSIKFSVSLATPPGGQEKQDETQNQQEMESKSRLIQEIAHLTGQKLILQEEIKVLKEEKVALQQEQEELTNNLEKLKLEENRSKTRLAQAQQNLDLMKQIQQKEEQKMRQNGDKPSNDTTVQEQQSRIEELEIALRDREAEIKKKEIQLQTEADMLHQRAKELKLKEYDMKNFSGGKPAQSPADFEHDTYQRQMDLDIKERDLNAREQNLFLRENELQKWHKELAGRNNSLEQWQQNLQEEDSRVQENQKTAAQMLAEVKKLEAQVLGAAAAADFEEQERRSSVGSKPRGAERVDGIRKTNITEPSVAFEITPTDIGAEEIDKDEVFARALQMEINQQIFKESEELVKRMAMENSPAPPSQEDEAFLWRAQLEAVGLIPGNDSVEEMKKRYEDFQRQRST